MPIIDFKATMCKHCYKCVRGCEVKSIMIRDGHAYIMPNRCILCGQCLLNCPQSAKRVPSELSKVKKLIESGAPVIASLSSSYMGVLPYKTRGQVKSALKKLGFTNVCDAAEGAALATEEYVRLLEQGEMKNIITTACPSIVNLIEIHYPELIKYLAPVLIPSGIHTRMLHAEFGEAAKVVVIGPCIAEKEKNRVVKPDAVLTFEDLKQWLSEEQIEIEACEEEPFEDREPGANLRYPVSGGLLTAVTATQKKPDKYRKFYVSGVKDCLDVCEAMKTGEVAGCFIEMNACHGGCVNGPSTATSVSSFKVKLDLEAMLPKEPADLSLMHEAARQVEIHRTFVDRSQKERIPTEEEIREILKKTGKMTPEQELNCGACGYPTCREKAIAVFQKKAEVDMCIPYLHDRAQSLSHLVMDTSPNLIMIIDDDMR
ncbi:[Fe-Fe] hydrogenase large subunit C-terminal domain-containing protein, partial [Clostridium sp.]